MKRRLRKISLLLAIIIILASVFTGCGKSKTETADTKEKTNTDTTSRADETADNGPDISKEVKLKMYLLGDKSKDFDLVYDEVNKLLKQDINATVEVSLMGWGEYPQKYPLIFASGEEFDVVYCADWAFYNTQAAKGGFMEITEDMLKQYAPKTAETIYKDAWEQAKINGKVYMLPMNYKELSGYVFMVRGDLMEKYGISDIASLADYEKYLEEVAKNEKQLIPLDIGSEFDMAFAFDRLWNERTGIEGVGPWQLCGWMEKGDENYTLKHNVEHPQFIEVITKLKDWKDKGFWSKSAIVNKTTNKESFLNGKGASAILNMNDAKGQYNSIVQAHPDWKVKVFDAQGQKPATLVAYIGNGMGIFAQSKNKERALMFLDLLRNDERYHDLVSYGIKGRHYDLTADNKIKPLENAADYPYDGNCNWGIRNDKFWKQIEGGIPNYDEIYNKWIENAEFRPISTFNFNDENVKNEVAAMNDIFKTDYKALVLGFTKDPQGDIDKMRAKLKTAGADKVYEEMSKQVKVFIDEYNNR